MCLYPTQISNPKYKPNKTNGGKVPPISHPLTSKITIPCGRCIECKRKKAREWHVRLLEEIKHNKLIRKQQEINLYPVFITLTFSNDSIYQLGKETATTGYTKDNTIATIATRKFLERWRKTHKTSLRHWLITELGHNGTNNIHLHGILWFENKADIHKLDEHWQYGWTYKGKEDYINGQRQYKNYVNTTTIAYIIKYVTKIDEKYKHYVPKILCSPGIGKQYTQTPNAKLNKYDGQDTKETYTTTTGHQIMLPTYWKNKIYTPEEREHLWLAKITKPERYVLGKAIDVSENADAYNDQINAARLRNHTLGYGTNRKNEQQQKQEEQLRNEMYQKRITPIIKKLLKQQIEQHGETPF